MTEQTEYVMSPGFVYIYAHTLVSVTVCTCCALVQEGGWTEGGIPYQKEREKNENEREQFAEHRALLVVDPDYDIQANLREEEEEEEEEEEQEAKLVV